MKESPNTIEQKRREAGISRANITPPIPVDLTCAQQLQRKFVVYSALQNSEEKDPSQNHITLCHTIIDEQDFSKLSQRLCAQSGASFEEQRDTLHFYIPCSVGIVQRRDPATGIVSPSHNLDTAFANSMPRIIEWIRAAEELNSSTTVSDLLSDLTSNSQFGYYPFGHTQQRTFCDQEAAFFFKCCHVQITEVQPLKIQQLLEKRHQTVTKLTDWINKVRTFFESSLDIRYEHMQKIEKIFATVSTESINMDEISDKNTFFQISVNFLSSKELDRVIRQSEDGLSHNSQNTMERITHIHTLRSIQFVNFYMQSMYQELQSDQTLCGAFKTVNSVRDCYKVATLWLEALKREIK